MNLTQRCGPARPRFPMYIYEVRPRKDKRGFDLISDALPFGQLCRFCLRFSLSFTNFIMIEIRACLFF
jgi:hypothetical protein